MSEKSIFFDFIPFSFFPARSPRADDPRDLFTISSPYREQTTEKDSYASLRSIASLQRTEKSTPPLVGFSARLASELFEQSASRLIETEILDQETPWRLLRMTRRAFAGCSWPFEDPIEHQLCIYNIQALHKNP
jgi:hypothetical protein